VNDTRQTVTVKNRTSDETFEEHYDYLILSPGCSANRLNFNTDMAFTLRNLEDTDAINEYIDTHDVHKALIVGAGYISLEVLENLYQRVLDITLIHLSEQVNKLMDQDMNQPIFEELEEKHI
ncbi:FAD-dependent oxidoreductase, partial [Staphylococcus hominis]|uniref:FAD-dependent oxidoreductase n=1 Tax=Staphylococcus hominis TaxID=1290 RepID=UPI0030BA6E28